MYVLIFLPVYSYNLSNLYVCPTGLSIVYLSVNPFLIFEVFCLFFHHMNVLTCIGRGGHKKGVSSTGRTVGPS